MCGIVGIAWNDPNRRTPPAVLEAMTCRLAHRGPDDQGQYEAPGVALGHRRLSIVDLAGSRQPLCNEDGTIWVAFNGELYGYPQTRRDLQARGHHFATDGDTELLVHLYEEYGDRLVDHLRGMFAFAIWDGRRRRLLLARDRLGQKPLVYRHDAEGLRFASEIKALAAEPGFPKEVDPIALDEYLAYQYVPHPRTIFRSVRKLPPAHLATYEDGKLTIQRYWSPPYGQVVKRSEAEDIERLRELLREAVRLRLVADVPLGAFLSGGIDSTIVVGLMCELSSKPVKTFSIGFPVKEFDESAYARLAAEHLGSQHEEFRVEPDAVAVVEDLAWYYDEPFADSSAVPTYYVSKLTRQHVTVALSGDAGDELFGGYQRYQAVALGETFDRLPRFVKALATWGGWQKLPASVRQKSRRRRVKKLLRYLGSPPRERYRQWIQIFDDATRRRLLTSNVRSELLGHQASDWIDQAYERSAERDFVTRTTEVDLLTYLPCDLLTKVDIASMAHGLECRGPFLDHELVEFAAGLPIDRKLRGRTTKYLLKAAFPEFLPPVLRDRPKMGFGVPIDRWLRHELSDMLRDLLLGPSFRARGWCDPAVVAELVDDHLAGRWDHAYRLWSLLMLELWARRYLDA